MAYDSAKNCARIYVAGVVTPYVAQVRVLKRMGQVAVGARGCRFIINHANLERYHPSIYIGKSWHIVTSSKNADCIHVWLPDGQEMLTGQKLVSLFSTYIPRTKQQVKSQDWSQFGQHSKFTEKSLHDQLRNIWDLHVCYVHPKHVKTGKLTTFHVKLVDFLRERSRLLEPHVS